MSLRCLADIGGPFYDPAKPFRNWSALPFYQLDLPRPPYVDQAQLAWGIRRAVDHLARLHAQGYTGIVIDNLAHLVTFERAPISIYPPDSPYRLRAAIYRAAFGQLFDAAARLGMEVFVTTDMQWSTPPLRRYAGRLVPGNPRLEAINRWALDELFTTLPQVRGVFVRVGETGGAHDQGVDYAGHLLYRTVRDLRGLIATLLPVCERHERLLIVRTWSIGIDELGDLMWSPARYRAVFAGFDSPYLMASIKHGPSDFFRLLPHNATLGQPGPAQIIELQNRREYELFGMVPSAVVPLHQEVMRHAGANPGFAGLWAWNSSGGWGGGQAALADQGWSVWTELSSALTAALLRDPGMDAAAFIHGWCEHRFGGEFGAAVADVYQESAALIEQGWYLGSLARSQPALGSLYVPPLLWVWWMRPTAAPAIWAYLAVTIADYEAVIHGGMEAIKRLAWHAARLAELAPSGDPRTTAVVESVAYLRDVIAVVHPIRVLMLRAFAAARAGDRAAWDALAREAGTVRAAIRQHRLTWGHRRDLPPLELEEIDGFLWRLQRAPEMPWQQARAACLLAGRLIAGSLPGKQIYIAGLVAAALLALVLAHQGRKASLAGALASWLLTSPLRRRALRIAVPWLNRRLYLLPSIFFETGPSFTEWTA